MRDMRGFAGVEEESRNCKITNRRDLQQITAVDIIGGECYEGFLQAPQ